MDLKPNGALLIEKQKDALTYEELAFALGQAAADLNIPVSALLSRLSFLLNSNSDS